MYKPRGQNVDRVTTSALAAGLQRFVGNHTLHVIPLTICRLKNAKKIIKAHKMFDF